MEYMQVNRANGRAANELRPVKLTRGVMKHAHGSCLAEFGDTRVLCAATIEEGVPGWRKGAKAGWVTAEYAMLPASTGKRCKREHANRKGRSMEIERLIGRSLRTVVNMNLVATDIGEMIELQGTGEQAPFDRKRLNALLDLGDKGIAELIELQRQALA